LNNANKVVARFADGTVLKGQTSDFFPNRPVFHVVKRDGTHGTEVRVEKLKALFFVKSLDGDAQRSGLRGFIDGPPENSRGRKLAVRFADGEFVCGYSLAYTPNRGAFFMYPADPNTNNERVFVVVGNGADVREGAAAEEMAQKIVGEAA